MLSDIFESSVIIVTEPSDNKRCPIIEALLYIQGGYMPPPSQLAIVHYSILSQLCMPACTDVAGRPLLAQYVAMLSHI